MRTYHVHVSWNKNGSGYDLSSKITVRASSLASAFARGVRAIAREQRAARPCRWREPVGSVFTASVTIGHKMGKETT